MNYKINKKILCIPPYLSTKWSNIQSIGMNQDKLQVVLIDGTKIEIPGLNPLLVESIFAIHAAAIESESEMALQAKTPFNLPRMPANPDGIIQLGFAAVDENGNSLMQHNPSQANQPDLPSLVLEKIAAIAKAISPEDTSILPKAEPDCNCNHCQIARAIAGETKAEPAEEPISPQDLEFQQWEIQQSGDQLFDVVNKLDHNEHYTVFLGTPIGCTCGHPNCEHIVAVLKS